ncbi:hypothetical protein AArcSl_2297 [Halalkaliarchaeum desulfuricum]|uniref:Uncharacterized protein n=1 Tax=Halalkaliarchaeum desulfuricum TaxID=2055893 RepID=A0A343TLE8_9EURY|nr:hypothetical protein [Halalkaliarchaeum desulfuricum]AUX09920.1 hypothetical protein AArcSl_2297 [Halalkaliarchaeum desulfuricum]
MLERFICFQIWWFRRFDPVFRFIGRKTAREEFIETAIETSEENIERTAGALGIELEGDV